MKKKKNVKVNANVCNDEIMFFDIEVSKINCHNVKNGNKYTMPLVYLCNAVLIKKEDLKKVNKNNLQIIREGEEHKQEEIDNNKIQAKSIFFRTLKDFINFCKTIKNKTICYIHNLSFEFSYLVRELNNGTDDNKSIFKDKNDCLTVVFNDIPNIQFKDSYALLRKSIKKLGDELGYPKLSINYSQTLHNYDVLNKIQYDYNERDNIICLLGIANYLQNEAAKIEIEEVDDLPLTSTGFFKDKRYKFGKNNECFHDELTNYKVKYRNASLDDNLDFYNICKNSFRGGLVSCNLLYMPDEDGNVWLENEVYHIDITSSYIYTMLNTKFPYYSKEKSIEFKDKEKNTKIIKGFKNKFEKGKDSNYMHENGLKIITEKGVRLVNGFYAHVTFKNIRKKYENDIPSIDSVKTSIKDNKYKGKYNENLKLFHGKLLSANELTKWLNDATFESILIDYDFDDIECDYIRFATSSAPLPYFEICYLINEFFIKQSLKDTKSLDYKLAKAGLNSMYGIKVEDLIRNKFTVKNNEVVVKQRAHQIGNVNNKNLFDEYVENTKNRTDIYSDGIYISTISRLNLIKMKKHLQENGCVCIYCDTDSHMFRITKSTEKEVFDSIKEYNNKITNDLLSKDWIKKSIKELSKINKAKCKEIENKLKTLGTWSVESVDENKNIKPYELFSTLGPKKYLKVKNGRVDTTISGLSKEVGTLIENYAKQQQITVIEASKLIFRDNTTFDDTCSGQSNIIKTTLDKNIFNDLRDENNRQIEGFGGNMIVDASFNLNSKSEDSLQKNILTEQTVSIQQGIIIIK